MTSENHEINIETLKYYRKDRGYSQEELADRVRVQPNSISRWEMGKVKVSLKHQNQLVGILGVSLDQLRKPLPAHKKRTPEKLDTRTKSTISGTAKVALDIVSETYHINRDAIMDIAPFLFHAVAAASLGSRTTKLKEMDKELEKVMDICLEKLPYIPDGLFVEKSDEGGSLSIEWEAINNNQLFFSDDISDDVNDISTNPFSQFLKPFIDSMPEKLSELFEVEWRNDELPRYHITESFIRDIILVPADKDLLEQVMVLLHNGSLQLKEINYSGVFSHPLTEETKELLIADLKNQVVKKHTAQQESKKLNSGEDR